MQGCVMGFEHFGLSHRGGHGHRGHMHAHGHHGHMHGHGHHVHVHGHGHRGFGPRGHGHHGFGPHGHGHPGFGPPGFGPHGFGPRGFGPLAHGFGRHSHGEHHGREWNDNGSFTDHHGYKWRLCLEEETSSETEDCNAAKKSTGEGGRGSASDKECERERRCWGKRGGHRGLGAMHRGRNCEGRKCQGRKCECCKCRGQMCEGRKAQKICKCGALRTEEQLAGQHAPAPEEVSTAERSLDADTGSQVTAQQKDAEKSASV